MRIAKDRVVAIDYTIRNQEGEVLDTSSGRGPLVYLHGRNQIVRGVESAIEGLFAGNVVEVSIEPGDAYGDRDPNAILVLPRRAFPAEETLEKGDLYRAYRADGRPVVFSVIEASPEFVVVDANHPLAGQTLRVHVEVLSVRPATASELIDGHVHPEATDFSEPPPA